jgi:hypothetical protein
VTRFSFVPRAQSYSHYIENYPLEHPVLGFVSYSFILDLGCASRMRPAC